MKLCRWCGGRLGMLSTKGFCSERCHKLYNAHRRKAVTLRLKRWYEALQSLPRGG